MFDLNNGHKNEQLYITSEVGVVYGVLNMDKDDLELFCFQLPENIEFCMLILTWKSLKRSTRE